MPPESLLLLVLFGVLLLLMLSRTRKQQREVQRIQESLPVGDHVMTPAGLFATVAALDDQTVVLETVPGQRSRWDRRAVARILDAASVPPPIAGMAGSDTDGGAGAYLEHGTEDDDGGPTSSGQDTAPPNRP